MCACVLSRFSCVQLFASLWTVACQASLSLGFSRQQYWSGLPFHPPGDLPDQGIELSSLTSSALVPPGSPHMCVCISFSWRERWVLGRKGSKRRARGRWQIRLVWVCTGLLGPFEPLKAGADISGLFGVAYTYVCWAIAVGCTWHWSTAPIWGLSTFCQGIR